MYSQQYRLHTEQMAQNAVNKATCLRSICTEQTRQAESLHQHQMLLVQLLLLALLLVAGEALLTSDRSCRLPPVAAAAVGAVLLMLVIPPALAQPILAAALLLLLLLLAACTVIRATLTGFHLSTGSKKGSMSTLRSSRRTAAQKLPFCSSSKPQAYMPTPQVV